MARPVTLTKSSRFVVLASICIVIAALYFAQEVLIPLALAMLVSFLLAPLVTRLERWRVPRVAAVVIVATGSIALLVVLGWVVVMQLINLADNLPQYRNNIVAHVNDLRGQGGGLGQVTQGVSDLAKELSKPPASAPTSNPATTQAAAAEPGRNYQNEFVDFLSEWRSRQAAAAAEPAPGTVREKPLYTVPLPESESAWKVLSRNSGLILAPLGTAGLVIVFALFMLFSREDMRDRLIRLLSGSGGDLTVTTQAIDDAGTRISRYLLAQAIVNGTYGVAIAIGLWLIGWLFGRGTPFPSVVIWGLLCAVLRFVPYIGPWIAATFPIALSFAVYGHYTPFFATVTMFVLIELLSNNVMEPWLYGSSTGMSTVAVLVSAVFWTWLWGAIGLLLATPLTVCLVVLGKYVPQLQFLDILLGDEPVLDPPTRVYQRLLALDQEEAGDLLGEYFAERSLLQVYDEVLLPALAMAEYDRHKGKLDSDRQLFIRKAMRDFIDDLGDEQRLRDNQQGALADKAAAEVTARAAREGTMDRPDLSGAAGTQLPDQAGGNGKAAPAGAAARAARVGINAETGQAGDGPAAAARRRNAAAEARVPKGCTVNIAVLPARDEADELAGLMLRQLLEFRGYCATAASVEKLASEMVETVERQRAHVVAVSALPPGAVTYSRYLCKRLHQRFPELNMVVGLWTSAVDLKKAKDRITCEQAVQLTTTLAGALEQIHQMVQPVIVAETATGTDGGRAR